jgi:hypothetical protein
MHDSDAIFSKDGLYRYALSRRVLDAVEPPFHRRLLWVMLNPSKANAFKNDHTVIKCNGFAQAWGFGHNRIVNLYALVSTDPKALNGHPDPIGPENDYYIDLMARWADEIVCAWGASLPGSGGFAHTRIAKVRSILSEVDKPVRCLGLTSSGQPRHPLRLPYRTDRREFNVP